jgi:asparagine synthase (glutamine-hydrolysing)
MCGINVVINGDEDLLREMMKWTEHRGTRSTRKEVDDGVWVGHHRLPIQGLDEKWDHPLTYDNLVIAGVGEFFNFRDIESEAENDFDVFARLYAKRGDRAFHFVDGFWALFIHDNQGGSSSFYTDYLAKKPLYYRRVDEAFCVSSEIESLARLGPTTPDELYFSMVSKWGYCIYDRTPYDGIRKIPTNSKLAVRQTIGPPDIAMYPYMEPLGPCTKYHLRDLMAKAVRHRLISDIPIAVLCSGGLDSTIILRHIQKFTNEYNVFFVPNGKDADFIKYLDVPEGQLHELRMTERSYEDIDYEYDQHNAMLAHQVPVDLGSVVPQYHLSRAIWAEGYNVAISGDGADELFGGYGRAAHYDSQCSDVFNELVYYHLPRLDRMMMNNTIELRCPFLSRAVIEHALAVAPEYRRYKDWLKMTFAEMIPRPILDRAKEPLKTAAIRTDEFQNRLELIKDFRNMKWPD